MKVICYLVLLLAFSVACTSKKAETQSADSVAAPAPAEPEGLPLAFLPIAADYMLLDSTVMEGDIDFFLPYTEEEFNRLVTTSNTQSAPDFVINLNLVAAAKPVRGQPLIEVKEVKLVDNAIRVYVDVRYEEVADPNMAVKVIAIERRSEIVSLDVFVDGQPAKSLLLPIG